jgi:hypothetical protein
MKYFLSPFTKEVKQNATKTCSSHIFQRKIHPKTGCGENGFVRG